MCLGLVFVLTGAFAQQEKGDAKILEIKLDRANMPSEVRGQSTIQELNQDWYQVEVKFSTELDVPEVQVKFYVEAVEDLFAPEAKEKKNEKERAYLVLTGEQTYLNVPRGREHYAAMYLDPMSLIRYGGKDGARGFRQMNVHVQVFMGSELASEKDMRKDDEGWFDTGQQISGVLIGLKDSPWWPSMARRYNRVKGNN